MNALLQQRCERQSESRGRERDRVSEGETKNTPRFYTLIIITIP